MWFQSKKPKPLHDDSKKLLIFLCKNGHGEDAYKEVKRIASSGCDLSFLDQDSLLTPLLLALDCDTSDPEIAKLLFAYSDDAWQRGMFGFNTLHGAAKSQDFLEILDFAIRRTKNINERMGEESSTTALGLAARNLNELGIVKLLANGASILAGEGSAAVGWCSTVWINDLKAKSRYHKYLQDEQKIENCFNILLEAGLGVNDKIEYSFRTATMLDAVIRTWNLTGISFIPCDKEFQKKKLLLLLKNGANPNIECRESLTQKPFRGTPIHVCERSEQLAILLDHGADPHRVATNGRTIIHAVIESRDHSERLESSFLKSKFSIRRLENEFLKHNENSPGKSLSLMEEVKQVKFNPFTKEDDKQRKIAFLGRIFASI